MKKILIYLLLMLSFSGAFSQSKNLDANKINVRELLYSNGYSLIYPGDSTGQFDYDNVEDPVLDLDAVNLRTLRRWFATYLDTVIVGLDTFVTLPPDTFLNAYGNSWLHSGQTIEHPPLDTFYVEWLQDWVHSGETIPTNNDSIYIDSLDIYICNGCFITTDTNQFYVKRDPCTYNCWIYSYDNVFWYDWFCEPTPRIWTYVTDNSKDVLRYWNMFYLDDSDSVGFERKTRYEDKFLRFSWDSVYWDNVPNDSLFMDGIWYNLPDTLPINVDSLIYVNNVPISVGDSINTHDSIYYNGEWVMNDTIHIVDNSITNELDSFYYSGSWIKNGMTLTVPAIPSLYYTINGVPYFNQSAITINESKWDYDTYGIHNNSMLMSTVGIGFNSQNWVRLYVDGLSDGKGAIYAHSTGTYAISGKSDTGGGISGEGGIYGIYGTSVDGTGGIFESDSSFGINVSSDNYFSAFFNSPLGILTNKINIGNSTSAIAYSLPVIDGDSLNILTTDGHGNVIWATIKDTTFWTTDLNGIHSNYQNIGVGINSDATISIYGYSSANDIGVLGESVSNVGIKGISNTNYSGYFTGGKGVYIDSLNTPKANISEGLTVGDSTVTQVRSMATFTMWTGTQAAYDAIGTKDKKTIYYIEQNFNVLQIIFFILIFFGSKGFAQSDWANVYVGSTEMKKIYVGDKNKRIVL